MINIQVDKSNKCNGKYSLYISFPYNQQVVNIIREQSIRYWIPESREWEIPVKYLYDLKNDLKDYELNIIDTDDILSKIEEESKIIYNIPQDYKFKTEPFKHQIEGIQYGLKYERFLLGDEQGLGKTKQIIDLACIKKQQNNYKHCLIICGVNGLKWNWKSEIEKHSNERGYILGTRYDKKGKEKIGSMNDRLEDLRVDSNNNFINENMNNSYFLITNIETLRNEKIINELRALCNMNIIDMIALDEGHKCFDYDTLIKTDVGELKIGDIVENKIKCNILSFNHTTNKFEYQPIKNHFKNTLQENLIELEVLDENNKLHKIKCTKNHKIYTKNRGYVEADLLTSEDIMVLNT